MNKGWIRPMAVIVMAHLALCTLSEAGLMDFMTIDQAKKAYEQKKYQDSSALL
jgi:hypothetical protein